MYSIVDQRAELHWLADQIWPAAYLLRTPTVMLSEYPVSNVEMQQVKMASALFDNLSQRPIFEHWEDKQALKYSQNSIINLAETGATYTLQEYKTVLCLFVLTAD